MTKMQLCPGSRLKLGLSQKGTFEISCLPKRFFAVGLIFHFLSSSPCLIDAEKKRTEKWLQAAVHFSYL